MVSPTPKKLSQSLFFLTAYSLAGAALMGSTIGLVAYQSRQFFFLTGSRHNFIHPPFHPDHGHGHGHGFGLHRAHGDRFPPHHLHSHHPIWSFFLSTCLPILVWIGTVFLSSTLINSRKWVPKIISARTGILASQFMFSVFWVMLAAIQEVQERLVAERRSLMGLDPIAEAMEDTTHFGVTYKFKNRMRSLVLPLTVIWYFAVVILGVATGLLTTSSSTLEMQLEIAQHGEDDEVWGEEQCLMKNEKWEHMDKEHQELMMIESKKFLQAISTAQPTSTAIIPQTHYSTRQRFILVSLALGLFLSQMKLFQWIIQVQSLTAYYAGTTGSVSSCLASVGLLLGTVMISLGVRYLPRKV